MTDDLHGFTIGERVRYTGVMPTSMPDRIGQTATVTGPGINGWGGEPRITVRFNDGYTTGSMRIANLARLANTTHTRWQR